MKIKKSIFGGAVILGAGAFIAKLLGAIYRVPLTNLIGGYGLGLYQMVFPLYSVLLDFSGAGAPNALSKIVSSFPENEKDKNAKKVLFVSKRLFCLLGIVGTLIMALFSGLISKGQGNVDARFSYVTLAPAIVFVCLISCYRGYFQGYMDMTPTAISQICEQAVKITLGLILVKLLISNTPLAVAGATFAITVSEISAFILLLLIYKKSQGASGKITLNKTEFKSIAIGIIKTALPVTLIGVIIPLSQIADSFIIINMLKNYRADATALFGLFSGVACTVMNLPVSVCYGVSTASVPAISSESDKNARKRKAKKAIGITLLFSVPCALVCFFFSGSIISLLFKNLSVTEKETASNLLKILSLGVVLLSLLQTGNALLIGSGKTYRPIASLLVGAFLKIVLELLLLKNPQINVYAGAIALIACYFTANLLNFIWIKTKGL